MSGLDMILKVFAGSKMLWNNEIAFQKGLNSEVWSYNFEITHILSCNILLKLPEGKSINILLL